MEYKEILFDVSDWIATITLSRPESLTPGPSPWRRSIATPWPRPNAATTFASSSSRGPGRGFCAGADMGLLTSITNGSLDTDNITTSDAVPGDHPDTPEDLKKQYTFPAAVRKPVIAAINGAAMGIGLVHTLYCDIRFASDTAKFGTAFAQRGLIAEHGISWILPRIVGIENALDLLYSAWIITAAEAKEMGLVSRVVPAISCSPRPAPTPQALLRSPPRARCGLSSSRCGRIGSRARPRRRHRRQGDDGQLRCRGLRRGRHVLPRKACAEFHREITISPR